MWKLVYTREAVKDSIKILNAGLKTKVMRLFNVLVINPFQNPPPFEKLGADLIFTYSRRINLHHRLVYQVIKETKTVKILRMWTHYE